MKPLSLTQDTVLEGIAPSPEISDHSLCLPQNPTSVKNPNFHDDQINQKHPNDPSSFKIASSLTTTISRCILHPDALGETPSGDPDPTHRGFESTGMLIDQGEPGKAQEQRYQGATAWMIVVALSISVNKRHDVLAIKFLIKVTIVTLRTLITLKLEDLVANYSL